MLPRQSLLASYLTLAFAATLPDLRADAVDDYLGRVMRRQDFPGLAVGVIREGKLLKARGYGLASIEHAVAVTPVTTFDLASLTKPFVTQAVLLLLQEGRLSLDEAPAATAPPHGVELGDDVAENIFPVRRGPDPCRQREIAGPELERGAGGNLDERVAANEGAVHGPATVGAAMVAVSRIVSGIATERPVANQVARDQVTRATTGRGSGPAAGSQCQNTNRGAGICEKGPSVHRRAR